jgi:aminopeptidase
MNILQNYAQAIIEGSLKTRPGEEAAIFTDESKHSIADELADCLARSGAEVTIFIIPESLRPFLKITDIQAAALVSADIVIYVLATQSLEKDLSQEVAFRHFLYTLPLQHKGRVCMMPGFTKDMKDSVSINYNELKQKGATLRRIISGRNIKITSQLGTDISFNLGSRRLEIDDGDISKSGLFGNIPAGEIFTAPIEETVSGKIVIDGSIGGVGVVSKPFALYLKEGIMVKMEPIDHPDEAFQRFSKVCEYDTPASKTIGEFGIGLNPGARIIGNMLMDEKVEGTVHFALGDSYGLGKTNTKYHTDFLVKNPTIMADEEILMQDGKFLFNLLQKRKATI